MKTNLNVGYSPNFQAKPANMKKYTRALNTGLKILNKDVGIIVHNSTVPPIKGQNTGIGSLLSKSAQVGLIPFLLSQGINSIQQEPDTLRTSYTNSPYTSLSINKNEYMFPIDKLATKEYGNLVSPKTIEEIYKHNEKYEDETHVNYNKVRADYDKVFKEAYKTLSTRSNNYFWGEPLFSEDKYTAVINTINFEKWKIQNKEDLEPSAIYSTLSKKYNNENWKTWNKEDRNLYTSNNTARINQLKENYKKDIDFYMFKQWLIDIELRRAKERNENQGINIIGDSPIAYSPVEIWQNHDLFMEKRSLGCPPDYFSKTGQKWGFAVLKPETIFNKDGSLARGGKLMQKRYEKLFESSPGGARIDHIIGLIDPYVYTNNKKMTNELSGRLYSSPNHPLFGDYVRKTKEEYSEILEKIVFPTAAKFGLTKDDIICEDLGDPVENVNEVMNRLNLTGIAVTAFDYRGAHQPKNKVIMLGSHDNESFLKYVQKMFYKKERQHLNKKARYLASDTAIPGQKIRELQKEIKTNKLKFISASFAELFTSPAKKVQIFFTDFFGIPETYNKPGKKKGCWELRLPSDFENLYYENVKAGKAINLPEVISTAIRQKGKDFARYCKELLVDLDSFAEELKR